jgi:hypothetical protein
MVRARAVRVSPSIHVNRYRQRLDLFVLTGQPAQHIEDVQSRRWRGSLVMCCDYGHFG